MSFNLDQLADTLKSLESEETRFTTKEKALEKQNLQAQLIEKAEPYVSKILKQIDVPNGIEFGYPDLRQEAMYMVHKSYVMYDPEMDNKFSTYMYIRVRGRVIQYIRNQDNLTRTQRNQVGELRKARHELAQEKGREPSPSELATAVGRSEKDVITLIKADNSRQASELKDKVFDHEGSRDSALQSNLDRNYLIEKMKSIPVRDRVILILYFFFGLTGKEIAKVVDLNHSYIYQLKNDALSRLDSS